MSGTLRLVIRHGYDPLELKRSFVEPLGSDGEFVHLGRVGLGRWWCLTYDMHGELLSPAQLGWLILHFSSMKYATYDTHAIGLVGKRFGDWHLRLSGA